MDETTIAIVIIVVFGASIGVLFILGIFWCHSPQLRQGERIARSELAYLTVDGKAHLSRNGRLILTDTRLLWMPSRLLVTRLPAQEMELDQIVGVELGERVYWSQRPVVVEAQGHRFAFFLGGNPLTTVIGDSHQRDWIEEISRSIG